MKLPKQFYYKNNRLQQLKGFYHLVQTGSITKAADKMGLSAGAGFEISTFNPLFIGIDVSSISIYT